MRKLPDIAAAAFAVSLLVGVAEPAHAGARWAVPVFYEAPSSGHQFKMSGTTGDAYNSAYGNEYIFCKTFGRDGDHAHWVECAAVDHNGFYWWMYSWEPNVIAVAESITGDSYIEVLSVWDDKNRISQISVTKGSPYTPKR